MQFLLLLSVVLAAADPEGCVITPTEVRYPPLAGQARITGSVAVDLSIDAAGAIVVTRMPSGHPLLQAHAKQLFESAAANQHCKGRVISVSVSYSINPCRKMQDDSQFVRISETEYRLTRSASCMTACGDKIVKRKWWFDKKVHFCRTDCGGPGCDSQESRTRDGSAKDLLVHPE